MQINGLSQTRAHESVPVSVVPVSRYTEWLALQSAFCQTWLKTSQLKVEAGSLRVLPDQEGRVSSVLVLVDNEKQFWPVGQCPFVLPEGQYHLADAKSEYALAWGLGAYQFTRYKKPTRQPAQLFWSENDDVLKLVEAIYLTRDLINTPTEDMHTQALADVAKTLAKKCGGEFQEIVGDELLKQNYPAIHAVGRAGGSAPRLIDLRWGDAKHPKITLVGKGVCFDTGGLDIKSSGNMLLMKKDMGGAAHVLGLASVIMQAKLKVCLRVLIPAVENSIASNAYRPGDVINTRKGLTVEIANTDAEGRVILADALTEAVSENPEVLIDIATLTGAARVALGTELPAVFSNNDDLVQSAVASGISQQDEMWRMPLFAGYKESLTSPIADLNNCPSEPYGGAITAALFLNAFVPDTTPWMHFDLMAWNLRAKPGRPQGGEAMCLRALFAMLKARFA